MSREADIESLLRARLSHIDGELAIERMKVTRLERELRQERMKAAGLCGCSCHRPGDVTMHFRACCGAPGAERPELRPPTPAEAASFEERS